MTALLKDLGIHQEHPAAHIIDKNRYKASWKEMVIRWGTLEFLVLPGGVIPHGR